MHKLPNAVEKIHLSEQLNKSTTKEKGHYKAPFDAEIGFHSYIIYNNVVIM